MNTETAIHIITEGRGTLPGQDYVKAWQYLIDTKKAWYMDASCCNEADRLIADGTITPNWEEDTCSQSSTRS